MNRRGFLTGALGFLAAPAIVRASSLMPVSAQPIMVQLPPMLFAYNEPKTYWVYVHGGQQALDAWAVAAGDCASAS